jgi:hypothetical protein
MLLTKHIKDSLQEDFTEEDFEEDYESTNTEPNRFQLDENIRRMYVNLRYTWQFCEVSSDSASGINVMTNVMQRHYRHIIKAWHLQYVESGICIKYPVLCVNKPILNYMFEFEFNNCLTFKIEIVSDTKFVVLIGYSIEYSDEFKKLNKEWNHKGVPPDLLLNVVKSDFLGTKFRIE